nr:MAG TPA: hypothetical protein [Caudoviricetes sp.]
MELAVGRLVVLVVTRPTIICRRIMSQICGDGRRKKRSSLWENQLRRAPPPDKTLTQDSVAADAATVGDALNRKLEPVLSSYSKDIDVSGILASNRILLILTVNGGSASKTVGNIGILANHWGIWTLTNFDKQLPEGDGTGYMSFSGSTLTVPQSYGWSYTVIFTL